MLTILEILMGFCQLCGVLLLLCVLLQGTWFGEKMSELMKKHHKVATVFVVIAMIGITISLAINIFD